MKLELNEVKFNSAAWDVEELGTLRASLVKGDKLKLAKIKPGKRVVVLITEKGEDAPNKQVVCSEPVSATLKAAIAKNVDKKQLLKALLSLEVIKNDNGHFLVAPVGEMGESFTFEEIEKEKVTNYDELVAF
jgi:hypothetical protein